MIFLGLRKEWGERFRPNWLYAGFLEVILICNIIEVPLLGHRFTWSIRRGAIVA